MWVHCCIQPPHSAAACATPKGRRPPFCSRQYLTKICGAGRKCLAFVTACRRTCSSRKFLGRFQVASTCTVAKSTESQVHEPFPHMSSQILETGIRCIGSNGFIFTLKLSPGPSSSTWAPLNEASRTNGSWKPGLL